MRRSTLVFLVLAALVGLLWFASPGPADDDTAPPDGWLPGPATGGDDPVTLEALMNATVQDRPGIERIRPLLLQQFLARFGTDATIDKARALVAIVANETPASWNGITPVVGDATLGGGPSIGPGQVYRSTAKALGLWAPPPGATDAQERSAYQGLASNLATCLDWMCAVFQTKLHEAGGDVQDAVRRYNGGGVAALAYQARANLFAISTWGGLDA